MKKVLLVDDDLDVLYMTQGMLSSLGFDVHVESSGARVEEIIMNYEPDFVILDVVLPDKSGIEICKELKKRQDVPVILISAFPEHKISVPECKADDFLVKPFNLDQLVNIINLHV